MKLKKIMNAISIRKNLTRPCLPLILLGAAPAAELVGGLLLYRYAGLVYMLLLTIPFALATAMASLYICRHCVLLPSATVGSVPPTGLPDEIERLQLLAQRDFLTGLYNRGGAELRIRRLLSHNPSGCHALLIADIDDFKQINDTYGHLLGDHALKEIAALLTHFFARCEPIGRIGGDEFVVFIENCPFPDEMADRLQQLFARPNVDAPFTITFSAGVAFSPRDGLTFEDLFYKADQALYCAKKAGKNVWRFFGCDSPKSPDQL